MSKQLQKLRNEASVRQAGCCWYCDCKMINSTAASIRRCTAEHLVPQSCGGKDNVGNVVAACWFCNQIRHRQRQVLSPEKYREVVQRRRAIGKWHGFS
ncbi:HNH endonuclease signature motif containing protein [Rhizobium sp. NZLR8]|uniref:HNH endonuclease n=1 Tax=Rhizobium sp. NZLR8 TaxID=2731104 RepID=UPI001C830E4D